MANFKEAYDITMSTEGGYADNKADRGGETYKGIARNFWPKWAGWNIIDHQRDLPNFPANLKSLNSLQDLAEMFYKEHFWDELDLDHINNQKLANELFDTAVNMGTLKAGAFLQRALNVSNRNGKDYADLKVDGVIGPDTLSKTNNHPRAALLFKLLNILQGERYITICENNRSQEVFLNGWMNRVFETPE